MKTIPLTKSMVAIVDDEDCERLNRWKWYAEPTPRGYYAARKPPTGKVYMHREIARPAKGLQVDHANGDGLDNRRENLRACTPSQNLCNGRVRCDSASGRRGVHFHKASRLWVAYAKINGRTLARYFKTEVEAIRARPAIAAEVQGSFARSSL